MDRPPLKPSPLDELRLIQYEARNTKSLDLLRSYFDRVQDLRRLYPDDFELQIEVAQIHEEIIDTARAVRESLSPAKKPVVPPSPAPSVPETASQDASATDEGDTPPAVQKLDAKTWQMVTYLALFFTILICSAFFYLIQTARRINLTPNEVAGQKQSAPPAADTKEKTPVENAVATTEPPVSMNPTLRLYTDLIPGTVAIDEQPPGDLKDGELILDKLEPGRHSIKVVGRSGSSAFSFDVDEKTAPRVVGQPTASNVMAVLVSTQDGKGRLVTNAERPEVLLDGKPAGAADPNGMTLDDLGKTDHDLQVTEDKDRQRFVLTYTPAPTLTVYVKSDPSAGTMVLVAGQDGADVFINNKPYRRQTSRGQVRIPLKVGEYAIRIHKPGFIDPPSQTVTIKKGEESAVEFKMEPVPEIATLQIKGALPGTMVYLDKDLAAAIGGDGNASISNVKPGDHVVELRREQALPKRFQRTFHTGDVVLLSGPDVTLDRVVVDNKPAPVPAPAPATNTPAPAPAAANSMQVEGQQVRKGGGFIPYHVPKGPGRYSFQAQSRKSGLFKRGKLQWYAGYEDSSNFILFVVDGKHAVIRETKDGHSKDLAKIPFDVQNEEWVQVDMSVKANGISAKVKTQSGGWQDLGTVPSSGRDFTQDKVGFYIPGNDEVAVSDFRFANH